MRIPGLTAALLLLAPSAWAQDALQVEFFPVAQHGLGTPHLVVHPKQTLKNLRLQLKGDKGERTQINVKSVRAGTPQRLAIQQKQLGFQEWTGTLSAVLVTKEGSENLSMPLKLSTQLLAPIKLSVEAADVDLQKRKIRVRSNRPMSKAQVTLTSDLGHPLGTSESEVDGTEFELTWDPVEGRILQMAVQAYDEHGFFGGVDLFPWRIEIPHEDVQFASGQHAIQPSEEPKLTASLDELQAALKKYGRFAKVTLFVAGHTDTVSDAQSNQLLSERRARSIALWFKKNGVRVDIRYAGFGESYLAVKTEDNVDELRNRRAEYIVAVEAPTVGGSEARWKPL